MNLSFLLQVLIVIAALILGFFVFRRFAALPLRFKLVVVFITILLIPLVILGFYTNSRLRDALNQTTRQSLSQLSSEAALQVDTFIDNQLTSIKVVANNPVLAQYLELGPAQRVGSPEEKSAQDALSALVSQRTDYIFAYTLLDSTGRVVLDTANQISNDEEHTVHFEKAISEKRAVVSGPFFDQRTGNGKLYFSVPVKNEAGTEIVGVFYVQYNANVIQFIAEQLIPPGNPNHILIRIVDKENFVRIAHTGDSSLLYKSYKNIPPAQVITLQQRNLLLPGLVENALAPENDTVTGLQNLGQSPFFFAESKTLGERAINTGTPLKNVPWLAFVREPESLITKPVQDQTRTIILIALGLFVLVGLAAVGISQVLAFPVLRLAAVTQTIAGGDLNARAEITTQDEIGTLANSFNRMASQLQDTLGGLEHRVAERTADLDAARLLSERRAKQFEAIAEVARAISSTSDLDSLLVQITEVIHSEFGFYHIGIFLLDTAREYAVLSASNSEGGRRMLERGHRLKVGEVGIVGFATGSGKPRVALDTGADATFFNNPDLPDTRSEIALPLHAGEEVIGALDVQSIEANAFNQEDVSILEILADQVSIAIQNARQYEETRRALAESESLSKQFIQTGWSNYTRTRKLEGVRHTGVKSTLLYRKPGKDGSEGGLTTGQLKARRRGALLSLPVRLRGEVIGTVEIHTPENRQWDQDELDVVTAIIERAAIAMENARLLSESQKLAAKERTIGEISAKISAKSEIEDLLKTAAQELGRSLPGMEVAIQLTKEEPE